MTYEERVDRVLREVREELLKASKKFRPMHSPHEGEAVIREEMDELTVEVRRNQKDSSNRNDMRTEAIQVSAMGARFVLDLCEEP